MEMKCSKGETLVSEGKTKLIWNALLLDGITDAEGVIVSEAKDTVTQKNDPNLTRVIEGIGIQRTDVCAKLMELMNAAGIPTAFIFRLGPREMVMARCDMIMLECIVRRVKMGSYFDRYPWEESDPPPRSHRLITEYFLKTTDGKFEIDGDVMIDGITTEEDDPFIRNPEKIAWRLYHPHQPMIREETFLERTIGRQSVLGQVKLEDIDVLIRKAFLFLEGLFNFFGYRLGDIKFELGITSDGRLIIADVVDQDSWRLLTWDWVHYSKQAFRDGQDLSEVQRKYQVIAELVSAMRIPRQTLVFWKASKDDPFELPEFLPAGVELVQIVGSGHKETHDCLVKLEKIQRDYPDGGVIIDKVGRSNGLGPTLATHTVWPVINVPEDYASKPQNIVSHLDMPSKCPAVTAVYDNNAVLAALGILAQKNPAAYMQLQYAMESLDQGY